MTASATRSPIPRDHPAAAGRGWCRWRPARTPLTTRLFGRQPIGMLLAAPYAVFIAVIFAFPIGFAVYMSFTDYYFTAPGVSVPHPFVGLDNYKTVLTDPAVLASFAHVGIFLILNVPLTVALSLGLAVALNRAIQLPDVLPGGLLRAVRDGQRRGGRRLAVPVQPDGLVNQILGPLAPDPSWLVNSCAGRCR